MNPWIATYSGRRFDLIDPKPEMVCIEDIAHALSNIGRFGGHTKVFYSVAQHSFAVSSRCCEEHRIHGLLHDAAEAYIGDLVRPFKLLIPLYRRKEAEILTVIHEALGVPETSCSCVSYADETCLATEAVQLMGATDLTTWMIRGLPDPDWQVSPLSPSASRALFMSRYKNCMKPDDPSALY